MGARTPTSWWHTDPQVDGGVVCTLCPRECHIRSGQRGFCYVRGNVDGRLELLTYGRSSGFCIDPIEKKPLYHFLPGTPVISLGTAGCNLGCRFCQNWDISKSREQDTLVGRAGPEDIVEAAIRTGCRSVAFTYNDPVIWAEYAIDIARCAREREIAPVAVTAGYISPEAREVFFGAMDAANIDLKAFTEDFYRRVTLSALQPVLDTVRYVVRETPCFVELTTLLIPGHNDGDDELRRLCDWVVEALGQDVPLHFSAFHPDFKMLNLPRTPGSTLVRARRIALEAGVRYAYVGNVHDPANEATYCPGCGAALVERDWYELGAYRVLADAAGDGSCPACGEGIPGRWESTPGTWGRQRRPVRVGSRS